MPRESLQPGSCRGWRGASALAALVAFAAACGEPAGSAPGAPAGEPSAAGGVTAPDTNPPVLAARADTVARGLTVPWAMAFAPDGRVFLTERPGRVRVIEGGALRAEPWATFDVYFDDPSILPEAGLLGIALAPDFATSRAVYVMGTHWRNDVERSAALPARLWRRARAVLGSPPRRWVNRVHRCIDDGGRATGCRVVIDALPASYYHAGGALAFGPDGMLYVGLGDALDPGAARERGSLAARILRFTPAGGIPADNPVAGSPEYATGLRNPQALAWHPATGELFATEHGPTWMPHERLRGGSDELDVVRAGADYGWPEAVGLEGGTRPVYVWSKSIAPAGLALRADPASPERATAFVAGLRGGLRRLTMERGADGWRVAAEARMLGGIGRVRAVALGPDDALYVATSNRDGRGRPRAGDDLVLRLDLDVPASVDEPGRPAAATGGVTPSGGGRSPAPPR